MRKPPLTGLRSLGAQTLRASQQQLSRVPDRQGGRAGVGKGHPSHAFWGYLPCSPQVGPPQWPPPASRGHQCSPSTVPVGASSSLWKHLRLSNVLLPDPAASAPPPDPITGHPGSPPPTSPCLATDSVQAPGCALGTFQRDTSGRENKGTATGDGPGAPGAHTRTQNSPNKHSNPAWTSEHEKPVGLCSNERRKWHH